MRELKFKDMSRNIFRKIHFVGVGGIGMSGLADILADRGVDVTGSDTRSNNLTDMLSLKGACICRGHHASNVPPDADLLVRSACIGKDNPEIIEARSRGIRVISRSEMLKFVLGEYGRSAGVTGTHGKTTTSGAVSYIADAAGIDPTLVIGGEMPRFGGNSRSGRGDLIVAEVDESDGLFREISVTHALVTNIEREHMENYGTMRNLTDAYRSFIENIPPQGVLVFNGDDGVLAGLSGRARSEKISYGFSEKCDASCRIREYRSRIEFDMFFRGRPVGTIRSPLVGIHNAGNILGAAALCLALGIDKRDVLKGAELFSGVKRRFDTVGKVGNIRVIEDYAHHPTELRSVIKAAKDFSRGRVLAVFQPHRYSRTLDLESEFSECFYGSDVFFLTDIYSADEDPSASPGIARLFDSIDKSRFEIARMVKKENVTEELCEIVREDDVVLVLGAGDIRDISPGLTQAIRKRYGSAVSNAT